MAEYLKLFYAHKNKEKQFIFEAMENFFCVILPNLNYLKNDQMNKIDLKILNAIL